MKTLPQHSNRTQLKSTDELKMIMHDVLAYARQIGATDAAASVNHDSGFSIDVRMKDVETVAFSEDKAVSVTVFDGHRHGNASSSDISATALKEMVAAAFEIAKVSAEDPCADLPDKALISLDYPNLNLFQPWDITPTQAIGMAIQCEEIALSLDSRIVNSDGVNLSTYQFCHGYATTQGFEGIIQSSRHSLSCSLIAKDKKGMQRDYDYTTARNPLDLFSLEQLAHSAADRALKRLGAKQLKTQKSSVIFHSRLASSLFSSFISAVSGGNLYRKNSFLLDAIGQQIFPQTINIHEQPHLLGGLGSAPFDNEGIITRNNCLIREGKLQQYVLSSYSARKLGLQTTANSGGVHNLTIEPTAGDLSDLLSKMHTGLLITELMGSGINILTGDYSRGASGFWVENGQIQYPVENITIAGNLKEMFLGIQSVGTDLNPGSATRCGSVLINEMIIAGK